VVPLAQLVLALLAQLVLAQLEQLVLQVQLVLEQLEQLAYQEPLEHKVYLELVETDTQVAKVI